MKKIVAYIFLLVVLVSSCNKPDSRIDEIGDRIRNLETTLETLTTTRQSLSTLAEGIAAKESLKSFSPITDGSGKVIGYNLTFKESAYTVSLYDNNAGLTIGRKDGKYFWMLAGEFLKDADGNLVPVMDEGHPAPEFRIESDRLMVSVDGGMTWVEALDIPAPLFESVRESASAVEFVLHGGDVVTIAKASALQVALSASQNFIEPNQTLFVKYAISGAGDREVYAECYGANGWKAEIFPSSALEGYVKVTAPEDVQTPSAYLFVSDSEGTSSVCVIDFSKIDATLETPVLTTLAESAIVSCKGGNLTVTVRTNMDYVVEYSADWLSVSKTKSVRQDCQEIIIAPNTAAESRTEEIVFRSGDFYTSFIVMQEADYGKIDDVPQTPVNSDLSATETANCYIVNVAGDFSFDASVVGNGAKGIIEGGRFHIDEDEVEITPASVKVAWCQNECISDVRLDAAAKRVSFKSSGNRGNALIVASDASGDVLWSWHIWCTNLPLDVTHNSAGKSFTLMDRNLGAVSLNPNEWQKTQGLFYQWGRKDPFIPSADLAGSVERNPDGSLYAAVENPTIPFKRIGTTHEWYNGYPARLDHCLWGNPQYGTVQPLENLSKSIYDPCPPGYMVPPQDTWLGISQSDLQFVETGFFHLLDGGKKVFYPYSGSCDDSLGEENETGYMGYYGFQTADRRNVHWFCRLWTSATGTYAGASIGGSLFSVTIDPYDSSVVIDGTKGDMRQKLQSIRCVKRK
ncbi:MAG: hypothetical protein HUJ91_03730 [Bacteroidales bacterium]|nr:hypothetical protein [Bacteroidales bacterium]